MTQLPYEEVNKESFARDSAAEFELVQAGPGTAELRGPCPRCRTTIRVPVVTSTFKSFRLWPRTGQRTPPANVREELVICTCEEEHPGRPDGKFGCGAFWRLQITLS